jgi:hypothetical protein
MKRRQFLQTLAAGTPLGVLGARGLGAAAEEKPKTEKKAEEPPTSPEKITLAAETTLIEVLNALAPFTTAKVKLVAGNAATLGQDYRFPPFLHGQELLCRDVRGTLNFLTGVGWEGSRLPEENRARAGDNYRLAHTPFVPILAGQRHWVCNNRCWDWKWDKGTGPPDVGPGGIITVSARVQPDGDVVEREPFSLGRIPDDYTLDTLLDLIKQRLRITVNVEGYQYVPVPFGGATRLKGMTAADVRAVCGDLLKESHSLGEWLSLIAIGLNQHSKSVQGDWKWSCKEAPVKREGRQETTVIYTLRDYAHRTR